MSNIISPDDYIIRMVNTFPSIFASPTYKESKLRIMDHMFNTIGNGVSMKELSGEPATVEEQQQANRWFNCTKAAYGYKSDPTPGKWRYETGDPDVVVPVGEKNQHPEINHWVDFDTYTAPHVIYPNFTKQYSLVWDSRKFTFCHLGAHWGQAAIDFYTECRNLLISGEDCHFDRTFPSSDPAADDELVHEYLTSLLDTEKYPTNEIISTTYNCLFDGDRTDYQDVYKFLARRWEQRRANYIKFVDETIEMLTKRANTHVS